MLLIPNYILSCVSYNSGPPVYTYPSWTMYLYVCRRRLSIATMFMFTYLYTLYIYIFCNVYDISGLTTYNRPVYLATHTWIFAAFPGYYTPSTEFCATFATIFHVNCPTCQYIPCLSHDTLLHFKNCVMGVVMYFSPRRQDSVSYDDQNFLFNTASIALLIFPAKLCIHLL